MAFSRRGPKMSRRRVPTEIFGVSDFFYQKFFEKKFRGRGPPKSTFFWLFSILEISAKWTKYVFCVADFFEKSRKGGLFLRVHLRNFFSSLY